MYAVIETGGKQVRVKAGDFIQVEKLEGDVGSPVHFQQVLFISKPATAEGASSEVILGKPFVEKAAVQAEIVGQGRGEKTLIIKMKRRKQYRRVQGHRQFLTDLLVTSVDNGSGTKEALTAEQKTALLGKFHTQLAPKGEAFTQKTLGSRVRMLGGPQKAEERKAAAREKKSTAKSAKKSASKSKARGKSSKGKAKGK